MPTDYHLDWSVLFWMDVIYKILLIICIIMLIDLFYIIINIYYRISTGKCRISIWHEYLEGILREPLGIVIQMFHVDVYYDNDDDRNRDQDRYQNIYKNLHFHLVRNPKHSPENNPNDNTNTLLSIDPPPPTTCSLFLINERFTPTEQLIALDHSSTVPERSIVLYQHGFVVKNIDEINQRFICQSCKLVFRVPYQLICGHRKCQSCIDLQNNIIHCLECLETSAANQIWLDKGFQYELECLSIVCNDCEWRGPLNIYQEHLNENHSNRFVTCCICTEQVERNKIHKHYLSETHQRVLPNILLRLHSKEIQNDQEQNMALSQIHNGISDISNDVMVVENSILRMDNEFRSHQNSFQIHIEEFPSVKELGEENEHCLDRMTTIYDLSGEEIESLKRRLQDGFIISFDGTLTWKISDVEQKMNDAIFERQRSIYSPEFYSSSVGYKMCLRLFLNGINDARGAHMSIYFILMRGEYDALLKWPFAFKVSFILLDQSTSDDNQCHISNFFWSNIRSNCFQRPRLEMNEAYGIEKFISLEEFRQNQHRYVQNDTMFIKIKVDFTCLASDTISSSDSGRILLNDERHTDTNDDDSIRRFVSMMESSNRSQ